MQAVYHLTTNELTDDFIEKLRTRFKEGVLDISVSEMDNTDYLLSSKANEEILDASIAEAEAGKLIGKSPEELNL